jgi:hypothetical protein
MACTINITIIMTHDHDHDMIHKYSFYRYLVLTCSIKNE